jgi:hypothetical protein
MTLILAQVFGIYFLIMCAFMTLKEESVRAMINAAGTHSVQTRLIALIALLPLLALAGTHTTFSSVVGSVVTVSVYVGILKSLYVLFVKKALLQQNITFFSRKSSLRMASAALGVVGVFFLLCGFGVIWL